MLHPTIDELNKKNEDKGYNRYQVALAAAKAARQVTEEYIAQKTAIEETSVEGVSTGSRLDAKLRDVNPVVNAVNQMGEGEFKIIEVENEEAEG